MAQSYGRYLAEELLGKGAMGEVYRGTDPESGRAVAIKVLAPQGPAGRVNQSDLTARFAREVDAYRRLAHPNILALYDSGVTEDNRPYLVTELLDGESLDKSLAASGSLDPGLVARIGAAIAGALAHAHGKGFVHRDVKPANIVLCQDGTAKLMDFGIARTDLSSLTAEGMILGSLPYSSPEQVSVQEIDGRSDLFSLGTTLYVLLTGRSPFARETVPLTIVAVTDIEPPPPTWLRVELSSAWDPFFVRALAKDRDERFADGVEMAAALTTLARQPRAPIAAVGELDLVVVAGDDQGMRFPLSASNVIGRRTGNILLSDTRISGRHCAVDIIDNQIVVRDLDSRNGVWVDGKRVQTATVTSANELHLGPKTGMRIIPRQASVEALAELGGPGLAAGTAIMPGAIDYVLVVEEGPRKGTRLVLGGALLLSGSEGKGNLDDAAVSVRHAIVEVRPMQGVFVRDLDSAGGTFIDDERVREAPLEAGNRLRVGATILVLRRAEGV